jgi:hypothetical protein
VAERESSKGTLSGPRREVGMGWRESQWGEWKGSRRVGWWRPGRVGMMVSLAKEMAKEQTGGSRWEARGSSRRVVEGIGREIEEGEAGDAKERDARDGSSQRIGVESKGRQSGEPHDRRGERRGEGVVCQVQRVESGERPEEGWSRRGGWWRGRERRAEVNRRRLRG